MLSQAMQMVFFPAKQQRLIVVLSFHEPWFGQEYY